MTRGGDAGNSLQRASSNRYIVPDPGAKNQIEALAPASEPSALPGNALHGCSWPLQTVLRRPAVSRGTQPAGPHSSGASNGLRTTPHLLPGGAWTLTPLGATPRHTHTASESLRGPSQWLGPRRLCAWGDVRSLDDLGDATSTHGATTLTDGELEPFFHRDGLNQVNLHLGVVAGHDHLGALGEVHNSGHVRRTEVELRAVVLVERRVTAALFLAQDVDVRVELRVRSDRARLADDLTPLDVLALGANDLDLGVDLEVAALQPAGDDRATTGDRADVLDGHKERLVDVALRLRNIGVDGVHELQNRLAPLGVALESLQRRGANDRQVVAVELIGAEQLANLELDELHDLLVIDHVRLVEGHHDVRNANLAGQEDVLLGLRHRAVRGGDDQDRAVHLSCTRDHVLDVVSVTGAVDVGVVTRLRLVLDVCDGDRDAALLLFGRLVDIVEREHGVQVRVLVVQNLGYRSCQRRLTVVDVTDGADVDVRLGPLELRLAHYGPPQD